MMTPFITLGFDIFIFYVLLRFFSGYQTFSLLVTGTLALLLVIFRIPQVHQERADAVLTPGNPQIIAHRGGAFDAPENTIAAFRLAKQNGADGIELDVEFTKDWVAVVFHDDTVDRTTNGTGAVHSLTFEELRSLDASAKHAKKHLFPNEKIPTLEEALVECLKLEMKIYIDVKGYAKQSAKVISELFHKHPALYDNAAVCSFFPDVIYMVRRADANIVTGLIHRPRFLTTKKGLVPATDIWLNWVGPVCDELRDWSFHSWMWFICGNSFFLSRNDLISGNYKAEWATRGVQLMAWNVNTQKEKDHFLQNLNVRSADPQIVTALTHRSWFISHHINGNPYNSNMLSHLGHVVADYVFEWSHYSWLWYLHGISAFLSQKNAVSTEYAGFWRARGIRVVAWTVNNELEKSHLKDVVRINCMTDSLVGSCHEQKS